MKTGPDSPRYRVPAGPTGLWTITSWSAQGSTFDGVARIRVYRRTSTPGQFELVKQSALETVPANEHPVFSTSLNVQKGDLLGIHTEFGVPEAYPTSLTGNLVKGLSGCKPEGGLVGAGTSYPLGDIPDHLVNVLAKLIHADGSKPPGCGTDESQLQRGRRYSYLREFRLGAGPDDELKRRFWG